MEENNSIDQDFLEQCKEVEQILLTAFCEFQDAFKEYANSINHEMFVDQRHALLYLVLRDLDIEGVQFELNTIRTKINESGVAGFLTDEFIEPFLFNATPDVNIKFYVDRFVKYYQQRQISDIGVALYNNVRVHNPNIGSIIVKAQENLSKIAASETDFKMDDLRAGSILATALQTLRDKVANKGAKSSLSTGFPMLDSITNGLKPGELIIVAGRPASGKSTFAMNICEYNGYKSLENRKPVVVFTLEMPAEQVMFRTLCSIGQVKQHSVQKANLSDDEMSRLYHAAEVISNSQHMYIDDSSYGLTIEKVRSRVRSIAQNNPDPETGEPQMGLVMIDYLQLLESEQNFRERHLLIAHIAKNLKAMAREFKCPVIALSQLNRNVDNRGPESRPTNADLRESGAIEQDADIVIMVHRPETNAPPEKKEELKGKAEIIITKNRQGEIGTLFCKFQGMYSRFVDDKESKWRQG